MFMPLIKLKLLYNFYQYKYITFLITVMLCMAYVQYGTNETKCVNSIILCYHMCNELCREPQM